MEGLYGSMPAGQRMPWPIGLTEYNTIYKRSEACGSAAQYITFLAQVRIIGSAAASGRGKHSLMVFYAAGGARKPCRTWRGGKKRDDSDSYGLFAYNENDLPDGAPTPAYFAFWLWWRYGGEQLLTHQTDGQLSSNSQLSVYVTRFGNVSAPGFSVLRAVLGVIIVNEGAYARAVKLRDTASSLGAGWLAAAGHVRAVGHIFHPSLQGSNADAVAADPTLSRGIRINGEGTTNGFSGLFPPDHVRPYHKRFPPAALAGGQIQFGVPAWSCLAVALHPGTTDPQPSPPQPAPPPAHPAPPISPPLPPPDAPPPSPAPRAPVVCPSRYSGCLEAMCCQSPLDICYKRPSLAWAQCRPTPHTRACVDSAEWLCPASWMNSPPPQAPQPPMPPPIPSPPLPPSLPPSPTAPFIFSVACAFLWERVDARTLTPPQWCSELGREACEGHYVTTDEGLSLPCAWDLRVGEYNTCNNDASFLAEPYRCLPAPPPSPLAPPLIYPPPTAPPALPAPACSWTVGLDNLRAHRPPTTCAELARQRGACTGSYVLRTRPGPTLPRCFPHLNPVRMGRRWHLWRPPHRLRG